MGRINIDKECEWFNKLSEEDKKLRYANIYYELEILRSKADKYYKNIKLLDEIEKIVNAIVNGTHFATDIEGHFKELTKQILQLIKQAKEGWE